MEVKQIRIADVKIGKRFRKDYRSVDSLKNSIERHGLFHPIVVTPDKTLVCGRRRLEAVKQLGMKTIAANVLDIDSVVYGEADENILRMDFTPGEKVAIAEAVEAREKKDAKARQGTRTDLQPSSKLDESKESERRTDVRTAKTVGLNKDTYRKAKAIVESGDEELIAEMNKTGRVSGVHKKLVVARQTEKIEAEPPPLPKGPFRVIVADPPWRYEKRAADPSHRTSLPYASMDLESIKEYFPHSMACKDAILWLWTTNAHLRESFEVMDAWGFTYKTLLTWDKERMGTGDWLRGQTEHCLFGVRGKPTVNMGNKTTIIREARGKHSVKPEAFYKLVVKMCPGSRVELFQRTPRKGFVGAGLEA